MCFRQYAPVCMAAPAPPTLRYLATWSLMKLTQARLCEYMYNRMPTRMLTSVYLAFPCRNQRLFATFVVLYCWTSVKGRLILRGLIRYLHIYKLCICMSPACNRCFKCGDTVTICDGKSAGLWKMVLYQVQALVTEKENPQGSDWMSSQRTVQVLLVPLIHCILSRLVAVTWL